MVRPKNSKEAHEQRNDEVNIKFARKIFQHEVFNKMLFPKHKAKSVKNNS